MNGKTLSIAQSVAKKIGSLSEDRHGPCQGLIYGSETATEVSIVSACHIADGLKSGTFIEHFMHNRCMFPVGVDPVGIFLVNCDVTECSNIVPMGTHSKVPEEFLCAHKDKTDQVLVVSLYNRFTKAVTRLEHTELSQNPYSSHVLLRLATSVEIVYQFSTKKGELQQNRAKAIDSVASSMAEKNVFYEVKNADVIIGSDLAIGAHKEDTLEKLVKIIDKKMSEEDGMARRKKPTSSSDQPKILYLEVLKNLSSVTADNETPFSPVIHYEKAEELVVTVTLPLRPVVLVHKSESLVKLVPLLHRSVVRQLESAKRLLTSYTGTEIPALSVCHYWPEDMYFPLSLVQTTARQDAELVEWRKELHSKVMMSLDRPHFRSANVYHFPKERPPSLQLINPHLGLSHTKHLEASDGAVHTVYGKCAYHHYMQDRFDDGNWGCAYRSLQTLISWFRLQGYTNVDIPTHRDIQQILVDIGDKEPKFVGSKQWIGSTEVSFVLDKLLNVSSKILFVSSGSDLANKGRELVQHFQTQGTPIMIGGGVLAHTILGVYYNDQTGDIKFLILDPHYTGAEDLRTIQDKGWCGWKSGEFWDASAYYNMCMPQRPGAF